MVAWCREGPPRARVDRVTVEEEPALGEDGFRVVGVGVRLHAPTASAPPTGE